MAVECEGGGGACARVRRALADAGVTVASGSPGGAIRVLVGPWARLRSDPAAALIEAGPEESGVYADFERARPAATGLVGLDRGRGAGAATSARAPAWSPPPAATKRRRPGW